MSPTSMIYQDPRYEPLRGDLEAQAGYHYLVHGPHTHPTGVQRLPKAYMCADLGVGAEVVERIMGRLEEVGAVCIEGDWLWVVDAPVCRFGPALEPKDNRVRQIQKLFEGLPSHPLRDRAWRYWSKAYHLTLPEGAPAGPAPTDSSSAESFEQSPLPEIGDKPADDEVRMLTAPGEDAPEPLEDMIFRLAGGVKAQVSHRWVEYIAKQVAVDPQWVRTAVVPSVAEWLERAPASRRWTLKGVNRAVRAWIERNMRDAPAASESTEVRTVWTHWKAVMQEPEAVLTPRRSQAIAQAMNCGWSVADLKKAIEGVVLEPFYLGANDHGNKLNDVTSIFKQDDRIRRHIHRADTGGNRGATQRTQVRREKTRAAVAEAAAFLTKERRGHQKLVSEG